MTDNLVKVLRGKGDDVACAHASHKGRGEERQEGQDVGCLHLAVDLMMRNGKEVKLVVEMKKSTIEARMPAEDV